jgi:periplasmic protein TonB
MRGSFGKISIARKALLTSALLSLLPGSAGAMRPVTFGSAGTLYFQESGAGAPLGKPEVSSDLMAARCITMVTPLYPQNSGGSAAVSTVTVRVVIWKSGSVSPMRVISGPPSLQAEAMNAVRLWRYRPFLRDGEPMDVTTDVHVSFDPGKPGGMVSHPNH